MSLNVKDLEDLSDVSSWETSKLLIAVHYCLSLAEKDVAINLRTDILPSMTRSELALIFLRVCDEIDLRIPPRSK